MKKLEDWWIILEDKFQRGIISILKGKNWNCEWISSDTEIWDCFIGNFGWNEEIISEADALEYSES